VWLIVKSKRGSGFQEWHRDFYLNDKVVRTIVVNLGAMKRSDVPGEACCHLREIPPEETTNEERKKHLLIQPAAPSDLKSPPETITAPSDLKSPPETITIRKTRITKNWRLTLLSIIMKGRTAMKKTKTWLSLIMKGRTSMKNLDGPLIKNLFLPLHQVYHLFQSGQYGSVLNVTLNRVRTKGGVAYVNLGKEERGGQ